jgi:hypothetical protein
MTARASPDESRRDHLIVASLEATEPARPARLLLVRLIRALGTQGPFAIAVNRQHGLALLCGFALKEDADRMAAAVNARPIDRYSGWKSQRSFRLNERTHRKIAAVLASDRNPIT